MLARLKGSLLCLATIAVFVSACGTTQMAPPPPPPPPAPLPAPLLEAPPPPPPEPPAAPPQEPVVEAPLPLMQPPPPIAMAEAPAMLPAPADAPSLRARYGAPDFIRQEVDSELWRYDVPNCAVFFFLYREGEIFRLRYSQSLPAGTGMMADPACVEALSARGTAMF